MNSVTVLKAGFASRGRGGVKENRQEDDLIMPSMKTAQLRRDQYEGIISPNGWTADVITAVPLHKSFDVLQFGELGDIYFVSSRRRQPVD